MLHASLSSRVIGRKFWALSQGWVKVYRGGGDFAPRVYFLENVLWGQDWGGRVIEDLKKKKTSALQNCYTVMSIISLPSPFKSLMTGINVAEIPSSLQFPLQPKFSKPLRNREMGVTKEEERVGYNFKSHQHKLSRQERWKQNGNIFLSISLY